MAIKNTFVMQLAKISKFLFICVLTGFLGGILGVLFSKTISLVTDIRSQNNWLICLLPIAGLVIVFLYKKLKVYGVGTNQVIENCTGDNTLSPLITPAIFIGSAISHLFGASVGREGAALQLGGGLTSLLSRIFHLDDNQKQTLTYCGMAGLFSAVFGTPFAAFIFALQITYVWKIKLSAVLPTAISSFTAYFTAINIGAHPERFALEQIPNLTTTIFLKTVLIALLSGLLAMFFCHSIRWSERLFSKLFKSPYLRILAGGIITVFLTVCLKTTDYNGAGVNVIEHIFENSTFKSEAFFMKIVFTCIAIGAGYKGGEIVPTLFIGATFGSLVASLIGLPVALGAAIGMTALFGGVTNCHIAAIVLCLEMFSGNGAIYIVIAALISLLSGNISLYTAQKPYKLIKLSAVLKK